MRIELLSQSPAPWEPAGPASDRIVSGSPSSTARTFFEDAGGRIAVGEWRCSPGRWRVRYDETEYCRILEGAGMLISDDGGTRPIAEGDEFVVPAGFTGEWSVEREMVKRYVVLLP